jgi:tetratricopeptide (TPR) repeat protein
MGIFQILMFAATLFFAYQIYRHVQSLEDTAPISKENAEDEDSPFFSSGALVVKADEAYKRGDIAVAYEVLQAAATQEPDDTEILNKLAFVTAKMGNLPEAIECYKHSLLLDDNDDLTHNALASLYRTQGEFRLAQKHYEKALKIDVAYPQTYYNYGNLLSEMGDIPKAEEMYRRALDLQSDFPEAHDALIALQGRE